MRHLAQPLAVIGIVTLGIGTAGAFSLLGPYDDWQVERLGYQITDGELGGPQNLGEEYRWNLPVITYGFTPDFLNYFGQRGREEVKEAVEIINDLPSMSSVDPDNYPRNTRRVNHRARQLGLLDLKTAALSSLVEEMGLTDPEEYVFTLRGREALDTVTNYVVIKRNFDPKTFEPTSFINGQLWTYTTIFDGDTSSSTANTRVDPLAFGSPVSALFGAGGVGVFITGLTRDDVGGLRYLYREQNFNVETAPAEATVSQGGGEGFTGGSGTRNPWEIVIPPTAPGDGDGDGQAGQDGQQQQQPAPNLFPTNTVDTALRPGIGDIELVEVEYDSELGQFTALTNRFTDMFVTNGVTQEQLVQRELTEPDIIFDAKDLGGGAEDVDVVDITRTEADGWINNDDLNGTTGDNGPGQITSPVTITFNKLGPSFFNSTPSFLSEAASNQQTRWGSFDGSTNAPVVYPVGTEIEKVERQVLGGN